MARPRLRSQATTTAPPPAEAEGTPLPPLKISGIVVKKADLVAALRIYVPTVIDIQPFEDGENFFVVLGAAESSPDQQGAEP